DEPSLRFLPDTLGSADAVAQAVNRGAADVGLVVTGDLADTTTPPITVLVDPGKVMAGAILAGQVQRALAKHLPDLSLARTLPAVESLVGGWTPEQSTRLAAAI